MFVRPTFFIMKVSKGRLGELLGENAYVVALVATFIKKMGADKHTSRASSPVTKSGIHVCLQLIADMTSTEVYGISIVCRSAGGALGGP
jgi:hypothetical protein